MIHIEMPDTRVAIQFASGNLVDQVDAAVTADSADSAKSTPVGRIAARNGMCNLAALDFGESIRLVLVRLTDVESGSSNGEHGGAGRASDRGEAPVTGILGTGSSASSGPIGGIRRAHCSGDHAAWLADRRSRRPGRQME